MKLIQKFNHTQKKGFALTEVLLAIAVIVIIGIAAYPLYKNARTSSEVEAMANDIAILQTNVQTLYSGQSSFAGLTTTQLESAGLVPDDIKTATAGTWVNSWGGAVTLLPTVAGILPANAGFTIGFAGIPQSACTQLVNRVAPSFIAIGSTALLGDIKGTAAGTVTATQVNIANIPTACPSTGTGSLFFSAR